MRHANPIQRNYLSGKNLDLEQIQSSRSQAEEAAVKKAKEEEVRDSFSFLLVSFASRRETFR